MRLGEERLRLAQRAGHSGVWDWDTAAGRLYWYDEAFRLFGLEPGAFEPTGGASGVYNSGHTRWDIGGTYLLVNRYAFLQSLDLTARIQNLLNQINTIISRL